MRHIAILGLLALTACAGTGEPGLRRNGETFHLHAPQHSQIAIAECVTTTLDNVASKPLTPWVPVTRQTTKDNGTTIELMSTHASTSALVQWMAWIRQDSSVEIISRIGTDQVLATFQTCTGQQPLPS